MTTNISINLPVPSISKEKYIELTGLSEDTVDAMLKDGRLPRHRLRKDTCTASEILMVPSFFMSTATFTPTP